MNTYLKILTLTLLWACVKEARDDNSKTEQAKQHAKQQALAHPQLTKEIKNTLTLEGFDLATRLWQSRKDTYMETILVTTPEANKALYYKWHATATTGNHTYEGIGYAPSFEICHLPPGTYDISFKACVYANTQTREFCVPIKKKSTYSLITEVNASGEPQKYLTPLTNSRQMSEIYLTSTLLLSAHKAKRQITAREVIQGFTSKNSTHSTKGSIYGVETRTKQLKHRRRF
jgi:hypothetical protein